MTTKCVLTLILVPVLILGGVHRAKAGLTDGLVAHYAMHGDALDYGPNEHHGTLAGATLTDRGGVADEAYAFDGSSSIEIADHDDFFLGQSDFTLAAWVRPEPMVEWGFYVFGQSDGGGNQSKWMFHVIPGNSSAPGDSARLAFISTQPGWVFTNTPGIPHYVWTHVAVVRLGTEVRFYVDGVHFRTLDVPLFTVPNASSPVRLGGAEGHPGVRSYRGGLDDVRIYNRALTNQEIQQIRTLYVGSPLAIRNDNHHPVDIMATPNPVRAASDIRFSVRTAGRTRVQVFDLGGRLVKTLWDGQATLGDHTVRWMRDDHDGRRVTAGIYFVRAASPGHLSTTKMILVD